MHADPQILTPGEIHLRTVRLVDSAQAVERARRTLSEAELERAARFRFDRHRNSYIMAHGALREFLGRYLGAPPGTVRFEIGGRGKPTTPGRLHFNASDSGEFALFAFAPDRELGVDIEQVRALPGMQAIAARFFCREEAGDLASVPEGQREAAFFACWTRKEAYIKAVGDGLHLPLDSFRVTLRPGEKPRLLHLDGSEEAARSWHLHSFEPAPGYVAALAYQGEPAAVTVFACAGAGVKSERTVPIPRDRDGTGGMDV